MQTLQEALEANSLEHKLEKQIKSSLDGEQMNEADEVSPSPSVAFRCAGVQDERIGLLPRTGFPCHPV